MTVAINVIFIEKIVFTCKVIKYNRFGMKQERNLMLTNMYLSNLKKKSKCLSDYKIQVIPLVLMTFACSEFIYFERIFAYVYCD
jgi:hypothetical protein